MTASAVETATADADAARIVTQIRAGKWRSPIESIRSVFGRVIAETGDKDAAKKAVGEAKKNLPGVMFSGTFDRRAAAGLINHSGLICADLDGVGDAIGDVRESLLHSPHLFAVFVSPTGDGVKAVFRVPADAERHAESFLAVSRHVEELTSHAVDQACKDVARLCFVSYDPAAFLNPDASELPLPEPAVKNKPALSIVRSTPRLGTRQSIAADLIGAIDWNSETEGFCACPGIHLHTSGDGKRDCKISLDGSPTIFCFHSSCAGVVVGVNRELRSRIGKAEFVPEHRAATAQPVAVDAMPLTECAYADLLASQLPPIKTFGKEWFVYTDGVWTKTDSAIFRPQAQNILPENLRTARRERELLLHLEGRFQGVPGSMTGFYKAGAQGEILLNAANGVLRVCKSPDSKAATADLLPHSGDYGFTAKTAANYNPPAQANLFTDTLAQILPDPKDRELLQLLCGYLLFPDCSFEAAFVGYGEAGSGKSTIAEAIVSTLGSGLVQRLSMSQICDPKSYHLPKLRFAAVNLGTELDAVEVDESANFKVLVSGERVEARPIYGQPFTMGTTAKLWFLANGLPRFKHGTEAELRRTRFIRFGYVPAKKDVTLKSRLLAERDGIFAFMVEGLQWLLTLDEIPMGSDESAKIHARFKITNDPLGAFVNQRCELATQNMVSKKAIGDAYLEFCEANGFSASLGPHFFKMLYDRFPGLEEAMPREEDGRRVRSLRGICLKSEVLND
jgi:P4 family phage/plasmid primase-like protien